MAAEGSQPLPQARRRHGRFNGAAAGWPRKAEYYANHGLELPEASMGPRPDGRGRLRSRSNCLARSISFNGAAAGWPRKGPGARDRRLVSPASMGPRPDGRGRVYPRVVRRRSGCASMGPRPDGRGRAVGGGAAYRLLAASMGPRPDGRGRLDQLHGIPVVPALQWGRGRMAAEGRHGRRLHRPRHASMGPRPDGRGRTTRDACFSALGACFNGAAAGWPRKAPTAVA